MPAGPTNCGPTGGTSCKSNTAFACRDAHAALWRLEHTAPRGAGLRVLKRMARFERMRQLRIVLANCRKSSA